jgi:protein-tyrosine phosphatase
MFKRLWITWVTLRNEIPWRRPSRGESGVWVGGIPSRRRWKKLNDHGVRVVVDLADEAEPPSWLGAGPDLHWFPTRDRQAISLDDLAAACGVLDEAVKARRGALICCGAGKGRAPTVYAAWLIWKGVDVADALARLVAFRRIAKPTPPQLARLGEWARQLKG